MALSWIFVPPPQPLPEPCQRCVADALSRGLRISVQLFDDEVPTARAAALKLGVRPAAVTNSLVFNYKRGGVTTHILVLCPGDQRVDVLKLAKAVGCSKSALKLASAASVMARTGFEAGGVAPLGHLVPPERVIIDERVFEQQTVWCGGGTRPAMFSAAPVALEEACGSQRADVATREAADDVIVVGPDDD
jgi:prolyl-tRNA editing enzyme YbaK/EbsC (Cys-tRNA(Pro) deacylase)